MGRVKAPGILLTFGAFYVRHYSMRSTQGLTEHPSIRSTARSKYKQTSWGSSTIAINDWTTSVLGLNQLTPYFWKKWARMSDYGSTYCMLRAAILNYRNVISIWLKANLKQKGNHTWKAASLLIQLTYPQGTVSHGYRSIPIIRHSDHWVVIWILRTECVPRW